jgi:hypothetical protein
VQLTIGCQLVLRCDTATPLLALAHFAFIPDTENRIALFSKWMWACSGLNAPRRACDGGRELDQASPGLPIGSRVICLRPSLISNWSPGCRPSWAV